MSVRDNESIEAQVADTPNPAVVALADDDSLRPAVRAMAIELAEHCKGADPVSVNAAMAAMAPISKSPSSWASRGQVAEAVKAYRATLVQPDAEPAKTPVVRTATPALRRTTASRPDPKPARTVEQPPVPTEPCTTEQPADVPQPRTVEQPPTPDAVRTEDESTNRVVQWWRNRKARTTDRPAEPETRVPLRPVVVWPIIGLTLPAFVAVWGGWVGLGAMTGFGPVDLLPGFTQDNGSPLVTFNTAITLPIGMETYAAYALYVALSGRVPRRARAFAGWSAAASLAMGALGQVVYHLLKSHGHATAPSWVTTVVACLPVAVLGMGAALAHMVREGHHNSRTTK